MPEHEQTRRIALVIPDLKGNGAERFVITLANALQAQGHESHVICFKPLQELDTARALRLHTVPMQRWRWIPRQWRGALLARWLDRFIERCVGAKPDLVLSNLLPVDRILCHSRLPNVHLVLHNTLSHEMLGVQDATERAALYQTAQQLYSNKPVVCVSQGVLSDFQQLFPQHSQARCIYNPVDVDFVQSSAQAALPAGLPAQYLIHIGKFKHAKRHDRLIRAYAQSGLELPLVLVGKGELQHSVQAQVRALGLEQRVYFAGFHSNPYPLLAKASGLVLSSDFEGLGLVILEALALGIPVISTDCPSGPNEILPAHHLVQPNDEAALARLMCALVQQPADFRLDLAAQFRPEQASRAYLDLIA